MDSVLRPRDIQARIRSGESPEAVAAAAQTSVDKIMGFATPVLAERAYVAEQALKASVRRRAGDGPIGHLGEAVDQRLATRDVDAQDVEWDAWRREDGRWTLVAAYPSGSGVSSTTEARFVYDVAGRYVMADDDEARWLVGERGATVGASERVTVTDESVVETVFEPADRDGAADPSDAAEPFESPAASQVPDERHDPEQLPLGDDAIGVVTGLRSAPEPQRSDEWMLTQASERATQPRRAVEEPAETLFDTPTVDEPAADERSAEPEPQAAGAAPDGLAEAPAAPSGKEKPRRSSKSKRASVPSWDEIMFGSGKGE